MTKAQNVYDGSDSEEIDLEINPPAAPVVPEATPDYVSSSDDDPLPQKAPKAKRIPKPFKPFILGYSPAVGELSREDETFCTFQIVRNYPYQYIGKTNKQRVEDTFFNQGKVYENSWELFYLHRDLLELEGHPPPLILVTTRQFSHFLAKINKFFKTKLSIPDGARGAFEVLFGEGGTPRPRYLGQVNSKSAMDSLVYRMPPRQFKLEGEPEMLRVLDDDAYEIFRNNVATVIQKQPKKALTQEKAVKTRIHNQKSWRQTIKRVQRYLGLRQAQEIKASEESNVKVTTKMIPSISFDPDVLAQFVQEKSVVFVCVDVEAYERDSRVITEIGFATLDTKDISFLPPGKGGANWRTVIRPRHFRISENKYYTNSDYVNGCADRFEFGTSEFISIHDASKIISDCFKNPVPKTGDDSTEEQSTRKVVFVGHDVVSDVKFLRTVGYDVYTLVNLYDIVDTAIMYRALKREMNTRSLGAILTDMGIEAWNLHNAGNDAVYTLQAMIAMAIKRLEHQKIPKKIDTPENSRNKSGPKDEKKDAWSSSEDSDGGPPNLFYTEFPDYNAGKRNKNKSYTQNPRLEDDKTKWKRQPSNNQNSSPRFEIRPRRPENFSTRNSPRQW